MSEIWKCTASLNKNKFNKNIHYSENQPHIIHHKYCRNKIEHYFLVSLFA